MNNSDKKIVLPRPRLPSPPSPLTQTQNRFISLTPYPPTQSSITRPTYSALARLQGMPQSPNLYNRSPTTATTSSSSIPRSPSSKPEFQVNPNKQVIKILEPIEEQKLSQGFPSLMDYIFPQNTNFYNNDYQTREYYEAVLIDSQSVQIRHNYNKEDQKKIDFSKVKIIKVLSPEDWGNKPFTNKVLSCYPDYPGYNYYDYIEAWNKAFLLKAHFHTWFFHFCEEFSLKYPRWFTKWYKTMGIIPEVFSLQVLAGYNQYKVLFKQENVPSFEYSLQFSAIFKLPWILLFTHKKQEAEGSSPLLLLRKFSVKWWKQIEESQANKEAVIKYHSSLIQESPRISISTTKFPMTNMDIAKKIKECENKHELERFINEIKSSPTPSEDLFQDSQDPYDDYKILDD
ncbi:hypothetical protein Tco_0172415 [Tanacetum coccineum]